MASKYCIYFLIFTFLHFQFDDGLLVIDKITEQSNKRIERASENECPEFKCKNEGCYPAHERCDGFEYCFDGSDEENCAEVCTEDQFRCVEGGPCIDESLVCDGSDDCSDGSDEWGCVARENCSRSEDFRCLNGLCIFGMLHCDGIDHCGDRSDEVDCPLGMCIPGYFDCYGDGRRCLKMDLVCDGRMDCEEGEDETECGSPSMDPDSGAKGHSLAPGDVLYRSEIQDRDHDEERDCFYPSNCHHQCTMVGGMSVCSCLEGYILDEDHMTCIIYGVEPLLWLSNDTKLIGYGLYSKNVIEQHEMGHKLSAIASESDENLLFWVNNQMDTIMMGEIDSLKSFKKSETLIRPPNAHSITSLAYDWTSRNLYWTELGEKLTPGGREDDTEDMSSKIGVVTTVRGPKGEVVQAPLIESPHVHLPNSIVLDPRSMNRHLYWSQQGKNAGLFRSNMDGSNIVSIVDKHVGHPSSLTIDLIYNCLVWFDASSDTIYTTYLTEQSTNIVMKLEHSVMPVILSAFEGTVYWGNDDGFMELKTWMVELKAIALPNLATVKSRSMIVHHSLSQPSVESPCQDYRAKCSHLCIPTRSNYICRCHDGMVQRSRGVTYELGTDGKSCLLVESKDDAFSINNSSSGVSTSKVSVTPTTTTTGTNFNINTTNTNFNINTTNINFNINTTNTNFIINTTNTNFIETTAAKAKSTSNVNTFEASSTVVKVSTPKTTTTKTFGGPSSSSAFKSVDNSDLKSAHNSDDDQSDAYDTFIKNYDLGHEAHQGSKSEFEKANVQAKSGVNQGVTMGVAWLYFTMASLACGAIAIIGVGVYKLKLSRENRRVSIKETTPLKDLVSQQPPKSFETTPSLPV